MRCYAGSIGFRLGFPRLSKSSRRPGRHNLPLLPLPVDYKPCALAVAHAAAKDVNGLSEIPPHTVGGFVYGGGPMPFTDIRSRGVRYAGPVGVELHGRLQAKQAGRYKPSTDLMAEK